MSKLTSTEERADELGTLARQTAAPNYVELLKRARTFIEAAASIRAHPLRDTHANDVPVLMTQFASAEIRAALRTTLSDRTAQAARIRELEQQLAEARACLREMLDGCDCIFDETGKTKRRFYDAARTRGDGEREERDGE